MGSATLGAVDSLSFLIAACAAMTIALRPERVAGAIGLVLHSKAQAKSDLAGDRTTAWWMDTLNRFGETLAEKLSKGLVETYQRQTVIIGKLEEEVERHRDLLQQLEYGNDRFEAAIKANSEQVRVSGERIEAAIREFRVSSDREFESLAKDIERTKLD